MRQIIRVLNECFAGKSSCCGAPVERWNDGTVRCSSCGKEQGR